MSLQKLKLIIINESLILNLVLSMEESYYFLKPLIMFYVTNINSGEHAGLKFNETLKAMRIIP